MSRLSELEQVVTRALESSSFSEDYRDEQRDLQPKIAEAVDVALRRAFSGEFTVVTSVGGARPKPSIALYGTTFWPDVEIKQADGGPVIGIEVKYARTGRERKYRKQSPRLSVRL